MPGRRHADFRTGDLPEGLALELLRPIAFVAPTTRPDDFGSMPLLLSFAENAQDKAFCRNAYEVLSYWIELDTLAIHSRRFGIARQIEWETNRMPKAQEHA